MPTGTTAALVAIPLCGGASTGAHHLLVNGKPTPFTAGGPNGDALVIRNLAAGHYDFTVMTGTKLAKPSQQVDASSVVPTVAATIHSTDVAPAAPSPYRDRFIKADRTTGGKWQSVGGYGKVGHTMWSWSAAGVDSAQLPTGVTLKINTPYTGRSVRVMSPASV